MKRVLLAAAFLLVACSPLGPVVRGDAVVLSLANESSTDSEGTIRSHAILTLYGAVQMSVPLFEGAGTLVFVDPSTYTPDTLAIFTAWWAGAGDDVRIRQADGHIIIEQRSGDEMGNCTEWTHLRSIDLPPNAQVGLTNFGKPVPQSSLAWCDDLDAR